MTVDEAIAYLKDPTIKSIGGYRAAAEALAAEVEKLRSEVERQDRLLDTYRGQAADLVLLKELGDLKEQLAIRVEAIRLADSEARADERAPACPKEHPRACLEERDPSLPVQVCRWCASDAKLREAILSAAAAKFGYHTCGCLKELNDILNARATGKGE